MKKVFVFILAMSVLMSLSGLAMAQETTISNEEEIIRAEAEEAGHDIDPDTPVSNDDILIDDGETKTISEDEAAEKDRLAEQEAADAREREAAAPDEPSEGGGADADVDPDAEAQAADSGVASDSADGEDAPMPSEDEGSDADRTSDEDIVSDEAIVSDGDIAVEDAVVGDDIEIGEGEAKIVSVDENADSVVGEDLELGENEAGIVSVDDSESDDEPGKNNLSMILIVSAAVVVGVGLIFLIKKVTT